MQKLTECSSHRGKPDVLLPEGMLLMLFSRCEELFHLKWIRYETADWGFHSATGSHRAAYFAFSCGSWGAYHLWVLIKLQGVVSLVFLQPKETWVKKLERKTNSGINAQVPLQCTIFFLTSKLKSHGVAQKQTSSKAKYHRHTIKKPVIRVTVQYCNSALLLQPLLMGRRNLLFNYVSVLNTTTKSHVDPLDS